jgi:hypothetical protein
MNDIVQDMNRKSLQSINDYVLERNGSDLPMILSQYDDDALPAREL